MWLPARALVKPWLRENPVFGRRLHNALVHEVRPEYVIFNVITLDDHQLRFPTECKSGQSHLFWRAVRKPITMTGLRIGSNANRDISCRTPFRRVSARRSRLQVRAKASENPFAKIGSQLVKAGSQLTETLTGTTRVAKKNAVDANTVFVAGATGRVGARIVKECVRAGFNVRAGVRNLDKGNELIETAKQYNVLTPVELKRINLVQYDLLDRDTLAPAIGNAGAPSTSLCPMHTSAWYILCQSLVLTVHCAMVLLCAYGHLNVLQCCTGAACACTVVHIAPFPMQLGV